MEGKGYNFSCSSISDWAKKGQEKIFHFKANHNGYAEHTELHRFNAFAPGSFLVAHPFDRYDR